MLPEIVTSGQIVDVAIVLTLLEGAALAAYRRATGRGPAVADVAFMLGAGLCLMGALRAALGGAFALMAAFLVAALLAHLADLRRRWPREAR